MLCEGTAGRSNTAGADPSWAKEMWGGGGWVSDWDPSLEGFVCHLTLLAFVCVNSKMRLPLSLSAPFQKGLKNVFDEAILAALEPPEPKKTRRCVLL